jgi:hypothetical protein
MKERKNIIKKERKKEEKKERKKERMKERKVHLGANNNLRCLFSYLKES